MSLPDEHEADKALLVALGYCAARLSLANDGELVMVWSRSRQDLEWVAEVLNRHLPPGRGNRPLKVSWQDDRGQGLIQIAGRRAELFMELATPSLGGLEAGEKLQEALGAQ